MLGRAQEQLRRGVDVVVGLVETHGRAETSALLDGLPQVPLLQREYQQHALQEMDTDAVLARRPALVLVDELAHRNVPQPPRAALAGCGGTAGRRHRRLDHPQHPARKASTMW